MIELLFATSEAGPSTPFREEVSVDVISSVVVLSQAVDDEDSQARITLVTEADFRTWLKCAQDAVSGASHDSKDMNTVCVAAKVSFLKPSGAGGQLRPGRVPLNTSLMRLSPGGYTLYVIL